MPASVVGLEGHIVNGWAYTLYDGSIDWDHSGVERNTTTVYIGNIYEKDLTTVVETSYYFAGSQRMAMRQGGTLSYFVADHLGSTSITLDASGNKIGEVKYYPFGETRSGTAPTDRRFTGQIADTYINLYEMGTRQYDPELGRWLSPDSIVPNFKNPQSLNRYSYVNNRPLNFIDPTGHIDQNQVSDAEDILKKLALYGVEIVVDWGWSVSSKNIWSWNKGLWELGELNTVLSGVGSLAKAMGGADNFRNKLGGVRVEQKIMADGGLGDAHSVQLDDTGWGEWTVVHEFAHAWDAATGWQLSSDLERFTGGWTELLGLGKYHPGGIPPKGANDSFTRKEDFAESVTTFVYPSMAKKELRTTFRNNPDFQYDDYYSMPRAQFVAKQLGVNLGEFTANHQ